MSYEATRRTQRKTDRACAGASTCYVVAHVCINAGMLAPVLLPAMIEDLHLEQHGTDLNSVHAWLDAHRATLPRSLRWLLQPSTGRELRDWVKQGKGRRGAVVGVDGAKLYRGSGFSGAHAVALAYSTDSITGQERVVMMDPWPDLGDESAPPRTFDEAVLPYQLCVALRFQIQA